MNETIIVEALLVILGLSISLFGIFYGGPITIEVGKELHNDRSHIVEFIVGLVLTALSVFMLIIILISLINFILEG